MGAIQRTHSLLPLVYGRWCGSGEHTASASFSGLKQPVNTKAETVWEQMDTSMSPATMWPFFSKEVQPSVDQWTTRASHQMLLLPPLAGSSSACLTLGRAGSWSSFFCTPTHAGPTS